MKTPRIYIGALAVFCVAALVIGSAGATAMMQKGTGKGPVSRQPDGARMLLMLDNLTAQGYDVTAIRNAVTTGDFGTAHTLMQELRTANPDAFPAPGEGPGKGPVSRQPDGARMLLMLDNLTAQGYDVTAIRKAVTTGDFGTAYTLMQELRTANPDAFPAHAIGTCSGHPGRQWRVQNNE